MKYLFLVHSHITYYLALSIIEKNSYKFDDVVLCLGRNYKNEYIKHKSFSVPAPIYMFSQVGPKNILTYSRKIKSYTRDVDELISTNTAGGDYVLYLPHFGFPFMQVTATNKRCVQVNFVEEGASSYSTFKSKTHFKTGKVQEVVLSAAIGVLNKTNFSNHRYFRVRSIFEYGPIQDKVNKFYSISKLCFPLADSKQKEILKLYKEPAFTFRPLHTNMLFFEGVIEQGYCLRENYYKAINHLLDVNPGIKALSIKYHPEQKDDTKRDLENILSGRGVGYEVIPQTIPIEQVFAHCENLNVLGYFTSLLFYAYLMGHKATSYDKYLKATDDLYNSYRKFVDLDLAEFLPKESVQ